MALSSDKKNSRKMFYSMGEVAEMFDVNASLIRFWEKRFDVLKPKKNAKGNRLFTPQDIKNLKLIHHLVKEKGMTLSGAEKYLKDNKNTLERDVQLMDHLQRIRSVLLEIKEDLGAESTETEIVVKGPTEEEILIAEMEQETLISVSEEIIEVVEEVVLVAQPEPAAEEQPTPKPAVEQSPESEPESRPETGQQAEPKVQNAEPNPGPKPESEPEQQEPPKPRYIEPTLFDF